MSIYALPGHKVKLKENYMMMGYGHDKDNIQRHLKLGEIYTVEETMVFSSTSYVYFEEVPGISFNPIQFDSIIPQSHEDDMKNPYLIKFIEDSARYSQSKEGNSGEDV